MSHIIKRTSLGVLLLGFSWGAMLGIGMLIGSWGLLHGGVQTAGNTGGPEESRLVFPETALHASTAAKSGSMAVATGQIDDDVEGLFALDCVTGDLQCLVTYVRGPKAGQLGGQFRANVMQALGTEQSKNPNYLLVTGHARFIRGAGGTRPAASVVYVINANTGAFATYSVRWSKNSASRGTPQQGPLVLLNKGFARTVAVQGM